MKVLNWIVCLAVLAMLTGNVNATFINPVGVTDPGSFGAFQSGTFQADPNLYADANDTTYVAPDQVSSPDETWLSDVGSVIGDQFDITLAENTNLTGFYLWNYRKSDSTFSVASFTLAYSSTAAGEDFGAATAAFSASSVIAAVGTVDTFAIDASDVKRVRLTIESTTASGNSLWGLNEFAFEGSPVPEPATMLLLGAGGLVALRRRN